MKEKTVVIIGGGFAGVYTAKALLKKGLKVLLISKTNHFTFTPLLHEVATGNLISHDVIFEYESFFRSDNFRFIRGYAEGIDRKNKTVLVGKHKIAYTQLVIATGATTNFRSLEGAEHTYVLKNVEDAVKLKRAILAEAQDLDHRVEITVIGGGPTGLELVFDISMMLKSLKRKCQDISSTVRLVHTSDVFCRTDHKEVQTYIHRALERAGVEPVCDAYAQSVTPTQVVTTQGAFDSDVTILCAGVRPNTDWIAKDVALDEKGHIPVNEHMQTLEDPNVFAVGDVASMNTEPIAKLAQTAVREAPVVAENIAALHDGAQTLPAVYEPKVMGMLFSLGFGDGVGLVGNRVVKGVFAWWLWRTVYLWKTPGIANKIRVAFSWTLGLFQGRNLTEL